MKRNDWCLKDDEYHLTVLGVVVRPDGRFLITQRVMTKSWAPGWWEVSGGGVTAGESSYDAVCREVLEETGLEVTETVYQFSLPNTYLYSGFLVHTLDMFFLCKVKEEENLRAMDDVADSRWMPLEQVDPEEFGLDSVREGVRRFLKEHNQAK